MIYFNKLFKLPGPVALGMSDNDYAMASELFRNNSTEYTWEQYYDRLKQDYPVRFFFASTLPTFFRHIWMRSKNPFEKFTYWLKCNFTTKHRYHLIDIRKATKYDTDGTHTYKYGWMDTDWRMVYAMFSLLVDFVEHEAPNFYCPSEEDAAKDDGTDCQYASYKHQRANYLEFMAIYNYWTKERMPEVAKHDEALSKWSRSREAHKGDRNKETEKLYEELQAIEKANNDKLEDMLQRLIKVRHYLWT